jgi:feruloyl-CoA synthase
MTSSASARPIRPVSILAADTEVREARGGVVYLQSRYTLGPYPPRFTQRLVHWAHHAPDRPFLAQRAPSGAWRTLTYAQTLAAVRRLAQALLDRKLSVERPLVILSGNSIEHALLALAAMHVGVLYSPLAPAYSLKTRDYESLRQIIGRLNPGLIFAAEGATFAAAIRATVREDVEVVTLTPPLDSRIATLFAALDESVDTAAVDEAHARVGPDTAAKILYTSGSTGRPKGVINTHRMLCSNQEMIRAVFRFLAEEPPVLCDWLPWNHTAGGNKDFGLTLWNGGSFYIDEGRPVPGAFDETLRNLREVAATVHFTVPRFYEMLLPHLRQDATLREVFFSRLKILFYAAAGLSQRVFDELQEVVESTCGERLLWVTGFGATETAPFTLCTGQAGAYAGFVGFPVPGVELKLQPVGDKLEARVKGPNVTPGYVGDSERTAAAFDEEGFYRLGDALRFVDPDDPARGLLFDGRLNEDFKLSTGTWVSVGPLRARVLAHADGLLQDVVIAGHDRSFVAALLFPDLSRCRSLCPNLNHDARPADVLADPRVRTRFRRLLRSLAAESTGSSTLVARAIILDEPPTIDAHELTDKGSVNQRAVLANRAARVADLYAPELAPGVLLPEDAGTD